MMNDDHPSLSSLLDAIFTVQERDIGCDAAEQRIANISALALSFIEVQEAQDVQERYPQLWQHTRFCPDCRQLLVMMMAFDTAERENRLPKPPPPPKRPTTKRSFWDVVKGKMEDVTTPPVAIPFGEFKRATNLPVTRGENVQYEPVEFTLLDGRLHLELDRMVNLTDPKKRDLICEYQSDDPQIATALQGTQLWLERVVDGAIPYRTKIEDDNGATFAYIEPDVYSLHWEVAGERLSITHITIV